MFLNHQSSQTSLLSQPRCYENPNFKACVHKIFAIALKHLPSDRFFLSGGCLSRSYLDLDMSDGHRRTFGDIDFKLPSYSKNEMKRLLTYFKPKKSINPVKPKANTALICFFNEIIDNSNGLKACYFKCQNTLVNHQPITYQRVVMNIEVDGISVDFVVFEESLQTHALDLDLSVCAGFYNPSMTRIFFPCDDEFGTRSAHDFHNKQLNLLFPDRCVEQFESDPTRLLRIVSALSRSDYALSEQLRADMTNYIDAHQPHIFSTVNPDRLYYHIKRLFFSGHAVKNLAHLLRFQLVDALFCNRSSLSEEARSLSLHLMERVAMESDCNCELSPSKLFYAVYWFWMKGKPYNPYRITELSNHTIAYSIDDAFDEATHQNNMTVLMTWEEEYHDRLKEAASVPLLGEGAQKKTSSARKSARKAINPPLSKQPPIEKKAPSSLTYPEYCQRATDLLEQKKYNEAKKDLNKAQALEPFLPDAYCGLGRLAHQQADGLTSEITAALNRLHLFEENGKKNSTNILKATEEHRARLKQQQEKYAEAVTYYEQALSRNPSKKRTIRPLLNKIAAYWPAVLAAPTSELSPGYIPFFQKPASQPLPNHAAKKKPAAPLKSTVLMKNTQSSPHEEQPHPSERWIETALKEEEVGRYQAAMDAYLKVTNGPWVIMTKQKCIVLYVKLQQFDKAFKQANYLVDISEDVYTKRFLNTDARQEAPFDCYRYHRCYSLYQRGKLHLNATRFNEAICDFELILRQESPDDGLESSAYNGDWRELFMRTHIKLGRALYFHVQSKLLLIGKTGANAFYQRAQNHYEKAIEWVRILGEIYDYKLITIYSGLAEVERAQCTEDGRDRALLYYKHAHTIIVNKTAKRCFPNVHHIQQQLHYLADQISGHLIYRIMLVMFEKKSYARNAYEQFFLRYAEEIYLQAAGINSNEPCAAAFQLIKLDLIYSRYNDATVKIQHALANEPKQIGTCQRELHLLLGLCYEWCLEHQLAFKSYQKASSIVRYPDDHHQHQSFIEKADLYLVRLKNNSHQTSKLFCNMRSDHFSAMERNKIYNEAYCCLEKGRKEHTNNNVREAKKLYRQYLHAICREIDRNTERTGVIPNQTYDAFYQFANAIIPHETLKLMIEAFLFPFLTATQPPMPLTQTDYEFFDILTEIYCACVLYQPLARFHLISIAIVSKEYEKAIEQINILFSMTHIFPNSQTSQRDLFYIAGRIHEQAGFVDKAIEYYQRSGSPTPFSDDNERAHQLIEAARICVQNIERLSVDLSPEEQRHRFG